MSESIPHYSVQEKGKINLQNLRTQVRRSLLCLVLRM